MHNSSEQINDVAQLIVDDAAAQIEPIVKKAEKPEQAVETLETEQEVTETDKPIEGESDSVEALDENQEGGEISSETVAEGDEEATDSDVDTLNSLAEKLDVEVSDLYALNIKFSEGEPQTLGTLKDFYEENRDIEQLRVGITEKEQLLTKQSEETAKIPEISNEFLQARANVLAISQQYERVDWVALRNSDPGQYAALQSDYQTQYTLAQQAETEAESKVDTHNEQQARFQQDRLFETLPELKDDVVRKKAALSVQKLASKYGFSDKEIGDITDSRLMHLLIDAGRKVEAEAVVKEKLVEKPAPKSGKSASVKPIPKNAERKAALKRLTDKAHDTGNKHDINDAVTALIG